jgi:hypothetical protein
MICGPVLGLIVAGSPAASASPARGPQVTTLNGYVDTNSAGNTYKEASAHWVQPAITCTSADTSAAFWVGIDGYSSDTVEQAGTEAVCEDGSAEYLTWWEMYPGPVQIVGETVRAGDHITVSVSRSGTEYTLALTDATTAGNGFTVSQACSACANSSAEWIEEPTGGPALGRWTVTDATVKSGSVSGVISTFPYVALGTAGPLNSTGNGFTVP